MASTLEKQKRVRQELLAAGITPYGLTKSESRALPDALGNDEHILAVIYGQFEGSSAMMVATDNRLLFINIRAMHNIIEDTAYHTFGDISVDEGIAFSKVTLRTRPKEYVFRMVNRICARHFLNVVEEMSLMQDQDQNPPKTSAKKPHLLPSSAMPEEIDFLTRHYVATLSTRSAEGYPYGATVFYFYTNEEPDTIYTITKSSTTTAENIRRHTKVAFTVTDFDTASTMSILGEAEILQNNAKAQRLITTLFERGAALSSAKKPPVTQIKDGSFLVFATKIHTISLKHYL